jgi:hypothetical protein
MSFIDVMAASVSNVIDQYETGLAAAAEGPAVAALWPAE